MPEGPEIHRAADRLARALAGRRTTEVWFAFPELARRAGELEDRRVTRVEARGKAILIHFENGLTIYSHNQLYGRWYVMKPGKRPKTRRQLRLAIHNERASALLYSASSIELLATGELAEHPFLRRLGPDVLDDEVDAAAVAARLRECSGRQLGPLLLDQGFVAGLGNYLRADVLHASGVHPRRRARDLDDDQLECLAEQVIALARQSYKTGGITNDLERVERLKTDGIKRRHHRFRAYKRDGKPCYDCGTPIVREDAGGRGVFYCPRCQPETGR